MATIQAPAGYPRMTFQGHGAAAGGLQDDLGARQGTRRCPLCARAILGGQHLTRLHGTAVHSRCIGAADAPASEAADAEAGPAAS